MARAGDETMYSVVMYFRKGHTEELILGVCRPEDGERVVEQLNRSDPKCHHWLDDYGEPVHVLHPDEQEREDIG